MCLTKTWLRLLAKETSSSNVSILATRSDNEIFSKVIIISRRDSTFETTSKVIQAINNLESYRNCECTSTKTCNKHLDFSKQNFRKD